MKNLSIKPIRLGVALAMCWTAHVQAGLTDVTPGNMNGWSFYSTDSSGTLNTGSATTGLVTGPATPPLGTGCAQLMTGTGAGDGSAQLRNTSWAGTQLSTITTLSYSTYMTAWNGPGGQDTYLTLYLNTTGVGSSYNDRLFFEPIYSAAGAGNGNLNVQATPTLNVWQTWNLLTGMWYSDNGTPDSGVNPTHANGPGDNAITLSAYLAAFPNATIVNPDTGVGGIRIAAGFASPGENFDDYVDNFSIGTAAGTTTYNFDPAPAVPEPSTIIAGASLLVPLGAGAFRSLRKKFAAV
jgi:hypothetical protein